MNATQLLINSLIAGAIYGLVALSFSLIYSSTRFFHFAHGTVCSLGAYGAFVGLRVFEWDLAISVAFGIFSAMFFGGLMDVTVVRPLRRRNAPPLVLLVVSLGMFAVLQNLISAVFGDGTKNIRAWEIREGMVFLGARITLVQIVIIATATLLFISISLVLKFTKAGIAMRSLANDRELSSIVGVNTDRVILFIFVAASGLAGIAGILIGCDTDITPLMGYRALLMGVTAAIVGGVGSTEGAIWGGLLIGLAQQLGAAWFSTNWQEAIVFVILILFLAVRPQGFFGKPLRTTSV